MDPRAASDPRPADGRGEAAGPGLAGMRRSYESDRLDEADLAADPFTQLGRWLDDARAAGLVEPNAVVLSTADARGRPSARTVLLKDVDERGLVVYTNYASRKGREVAENPYASLLLPWHPMERQVIVTGAVERVPRAETGAYFASRPRGSQLGAWASAQSQPVASREELEEQYADVQRRFEGGDVPAPEGWGGLRVVPDAVEFWQGRRSRLHDRLRYRRDEPGAPWRVERLQP